MKPLFFDVAIGNPPYQEDRNGAGRKRVSVDIFPNFQNVSLLVAHRTSLVYPATWQKDILKGFGKTLVRDCLVASDSYASDVVFPSIHGNYPLSIVFCIGCTENHDSGRNKNSDVENILKDHIVVNGLDIPRDANLWIDNPAKEILVRRTKDFPKLDTRITFTSDADNVENLRKTKNIDFRTINDRDISVHVVSIYIKKRPGPQADGEVFWISESDAMKIVNENLLFSYDVATRTRTIGRLPVLMSVKNTVAHLQARVFGPREIFSNTWGLLKSFSTEEEANNFAKYVDTKIFFILLELGFMRHNYATHVPDLQDWTDNNTMVDFSTTVNELDEQLMVLFGLSESEKKVVREEFKNFGRR